MSKKPKDEGSTDASRGIGDNSDAQLKAFVERLERLDEEAVALNRDRADIFAEIKASGEDPASVRAALRWRRDPAAAQGKDEARDKVLRRLGVKL